MRSSQTVEKKPKAQQNGDESVPFGGNADSAPLADTSPETKPDKPRAAAKQPARKPAASDYPSTDPQRFAQDIEVKIASKISKQEELGIQNDARRPLQDVGP